MGQAPVAGQRLAIQPVKVFAVHDAKGPVRPAGGRGHDVRPDVDRSLCVRRAGLPLREPAAVGGFVLVGLEQLVGMVCDAIEPGAVQCQQSGRPVQQGRRDLGLQPVRRRERRCGDAESGRQLEISFDEAAQAGYTAAFDEYAATIRRLAMRNGGRYAGVPTSLLVEDAIFSQIMRAGVA